MNKKSALSLFAFLTLTLGASSEAPSSPEAAKAAMIGQMRESVAKIAHEYGDIPYGFIFTNDPTVGKIIADNVKVIEQSLPLEGIIKDQLGTLEEVNAEIKAARASLRVAQEQAAEAEGALAQRHAEIEEAEGQLAALQSETEGLAAQIAPMKAVVSAMDEVMGMYRGELVGAGALVAEATPQPTKAPEPVAAAPEPSSSTETLVLEMERPAERPLRVVLDEKIPGRSTGIEPRRERSTKGATPAEQVLLSADLIRARYE